MVIGNRNTLIFFRFFRLLSEVISMLDAKLVENRHVTLAAKQLLQKWNNPALASQKRLILTKRLLSDSTKKALNEEYERIRRLARQNIAHREGAENRLVLDYTEFVTVNGQLLS